MVHAMATSRTKGDVVCIRRSSVGNISLVASKSVRLDLVNSSSSLFSAFLRFHLRRHVRVRVADLAEMALHVRERSPLQWLGTISSDCRPFAQVVKFKLALLAMVPPRPGRRWRREGFGARRAGWGAGHRGYAWHRMNRGGGRNNRGQWDHGNSVNPGWRGEAQRGQDPRPWEGNPPAQNVVNPSMEPAAGNLAPNSPPTIDRNLGK
jgi:hypothetical protein